MTPSTKPVTRLEEIEADLNAYRQGWIQYDRSHVLELQRERREIIAKRGPAMSKLIETPYGRKTPELLCRASKKSWDTKHRNFCRNSIETESNLEKRMAINVRTKGQEGEREIQRALELIIRKVMTEGGYPLPEKAIVQRNQNQSAVGGSDLSNTFGMCIEVKRQEQLAINTWWKQCTEAADDNGEHPVLLYRQNGKKWRCVTLVWLPLHNGTQQQARAEMDWDTFLGWFEQWVRLKLVAGEVPRV